MNLTNRLVIADLISALRKIDTPHHELVLNEEEWKNLSDRRIDLIFVADNPGDKEKDNSRYLHGPAGKKGRKFIRHYRDIDRRRGQTLILNKTPYHSTTSDKLTDSSNCVRRSVEETFSALVQFWKINKGVKIVIAGYSKNLINKLLFETYSKCDTEKFKAALYFTNHPSNGHLDSQFAECLVAELKTKRKVKMARVLKRMKKLSAVKIREQHGVEVI
jgi:hypothetical protein